MVRATVTKWGRRFSKVALEFIKIFSQGRIRGLKNSLQCKSIDLLLKIDVNCLNLHKINLEFELKSNFEVHKLDISKLK